MTDQLITNTSFLNVPMGNPPCEGRKAFEYVINFADGLQATLDLTNFFQQGTIASIQSMYVDNSENDVPIIVDMGGTNQNVVIPAGFEAYLPVLQANPPVLNFSCSAAVIVTVQLMNFFVPPYMWNASGGSVPSVVSDAVLDSTVSNNRVNTTNYNGQVVLTDISGTITVGGTAQVLAAANPARQRLQINNPSTATESLSIMYGVDTAGKWEIPKGTNWIEPDPVSSQEIWIEAPTTGHAFTAYEG